MEEFGSGNSQGHHLKQENTLTQCSLQLTPHKSHSQQKRNQHGNKENNGRSEAGEFWVHREQNNTKLQQFLAEQFQHHKQVQK